MKVEEAVKKLMDFLYEAFSGYADKHGYEDDFIKNIPDHLETYVMKPLSQFTVNDIAKSDGNELHIDCKDYYFCSTKIWDGNRDVSAKGVVEKELGLIER